MSDVDPGAQACGEHDGRQRPATTCSGSTSGAGPSRSNPTSAIVVSQRAARRRQRDDLIALPSTWVVARIAGRVP